METFTEVLGNWVIQNPSWTSVIIGIGMILQGELTILLSTYLVVQGSISWGEFIVPGYGFLAIAEIFVYFVGRFIRTTRFGWKLSKKLKEKKKVQFYTYHLKKNMTKLVVISKFIPATNLMILLLIGWSKTKFKDFLKSYLTGLTSWFVLMTIAAYFLMSGLYYLESQKIFKQVELVILGIFILIFVGEYLFKKLFRKYTYLQQKLEALGIMLGGEKINTPDKK